MKAKIGSFFDAMDSVLVHKPAIPPLVMVKSGAVPE